MKKSFIGTIALLLMIVLISNPITVFADEDNLNTNIVIGMDENGLIKLTGDDVDAEKESAKAWSLLIDRYKNFVIGISGIGAVTMVALFIVYFLRLGAVGAYPMDRRRILIGLFVTGISAAMLGAISLVTYVFYFALK